MVADREAGPPTLTTRVQRIVERLRRLGPIAAALGVLARYDRAGGGLLAAGLAYSAMFALLPALLLIVGVAGLVIDDPARRAELVDALARQVPPLEEFFTVALGEMTKGAAPFSTLALIGLVWGASRFYGALDDAFSRVFVAAAPRSLLDRTVRGLASVVVLLVGFVLALFVTSAASFLEASLPAGASGDRTVARLVSPAIAAAVVSAAVAILYRIVPTMTVRWRALGLPAVVVGVVLALFTDLFAYIAPRLVGSASVYGSFVAVFAALIWLGIVFQGLLIGAAWVAERTVRPIAYGSGDRP